MDSLKKLIYKAGYGGRNMGAFKATKKESKVLNLRDYKKNESILGLVVSRSYMNKETEKFF